MIYVLEISPPVGVSSPVIRVATQTKTTSPTDTPPNTTYHGTLLDAGKLERTVLPGAAAVPQSSVRYVPFELANLDGRYDNLFNLGLDGWSYVLKMIGDITAEVSSGIVLMTGTLNGIEQSDALRSLRLSVFDKMSTLDQPFLKQFYGGTVTGSGPSADGDAQLEGRLKPAIFGAVFNVEALLVNPFDLIYQVSSLPIESIIVYEGGLRLDVGADFPTLAALQAGSAAAGSFTTCLALGLFRLHASAESVVTADVIEGTGSSSRSASSVAQRLLLAFDGNIALDDPAFLDVHVYNPSEVGIFIQDESSVISLVGQVLHSIGATLVTNINGQFRPVAVVVPTDTALANYTMRDIAIDGFSLSPLVAPTDNATVPIWRVTCNYAKVWRVQTELYGAVTPERRNLVTQEWRKSTPAEDPSVKVAHPLSQEIVKDTLLTQKAAADAEAARMLAIFKTRRDSATVVPVKFDEARQRDIGDTVAITMPRFGYNSGRKFMVVGRTDDNSNRLIMLSLWG